MNQTKMHPPIPTVSDFDETKTYLLKGIEKEPIEPFKPMDMCFSNNHPYIGIGVILMGSIYIPYFEDGCASDHAYKPLDIQNPEEWKQTFTAYIVFDLDKQDYVICNAGNIRKLDEAHMEGHIPYDHATARLRCSLGLIEIANKWWAKKD